MRIFLLLLAVFVTSAASQIQAAEADPKEGNQWNIGTPIVTYWAGPPMTETVAKQMAEGGFNLVWCGENQLDTVQRHGLRALLQSGLLTPASLDAPTQREKLDMFIDRARKHPAMYAYFLTDEPSAAAFPSWGKLVAYLRERDPLHLAYLNLFPTYASNEQLGNKGDVVTAYREHLRQFVEIVKPGLVSYDHYQFVVGHDNKEYFLNLSLIQQAAQNAGLPFLNIVQACTWTPSMREPTTNELRYLIHTSAAYGAQGISYYVYCHPGHTGGIALPDGTPTALFHELKTANREFVAMARELQPLRQLGAYHTAMKEPGCKPLPAESTFRLDSSKSTAQPRGFLLTCFGRQAEATHACVVNLDYTTNAIASVMGPKQLHLFDASSGKWSAVGHSSTEVRLRPGECRLLRWGP